MNKESFTELLYIFTIRSKMDAWMCEMPDAPHRFTDALFETWGTGCENLANRAAEILDEALPDSPLKERVHKLLEPDPDSFDEDFDEEQEWEELKTELEKLAAEGTAKCE